MLKILHLEQNPKVLVLTPLKSGDKISNETKKTIKRNDIPFVWASYESDNIRPINLRLGIEEFEAKYKILPPFLLPLDNNISLGRHYIDRLYGALSTPKLQGFGYAYGNLEYKGQVSAKFPAIPFDLYKLMQHNYISSNSLFNMKLIKMVPLVEDLDLKRLLDWAYLLKLARLGIFGVPVPSANHAALTASENISANGSDDYRIKYERVVQRFVTPLMQDIETARKMIKEQQKNEETADKEDDSVVKLI